MLNNEQIAIINATVPAVKAHARDISDCFYPLMFARYPEVKRFFNEANQQRGTQRQALANAVVAYAANIERLEVLGDAVSLIAHKHCSLGILPEHYPIVGECLLDAIAEVLGDAASEDVLAAWGAAYGQLVEILTGAEASIYQRNAERAGGWRGERVFVVTEKVCESDVICSFRLQAKDGGPRIEFQPGQYICLIQDIADDDGINKTQRRNYSLSDAPSDAGLRISVKRETGGVFSNYLHDEVEVGDELSLTAPCGDFVLKSDSSAEKQRPLFLVTAGVGITPAISMLNASVCGDREIHFVHAALNSRAHAFAGHVDSLAAKHNNLQRHYLYNQPLSDDRPDSEGYLSAELLAELLPADRDVDFYFLGPKPFMVAAGGYARELGVPAEQCFYEFFGPLQELEEASLSEDVAA